MFHEWKMKPWSRTGSSSSRQFKRVRSALTGSLPPSRSLVKWLFVGGIFWALFFLLTCGMLLVACGSVSVTISSTGNCNKKSSSYQILDSWGFIPKPVHRCSIPLASSVDQVKIPTSRPDNAKLKNLTYITHDKVAQAATNGVALFGGHQTWKKREESFRIKRNMQVHCGFIHNSGGDIDPRDKEYLKRCEFVVASGIFDGYDMPHQPSNISERSRDLFCFVMTVDEKSLENIRDDPSGNLTADSGGGIWVGIWRLLLLRNLPYDEPRRNGKIPKLLTHRIFPQAKYSIWIDGKMELIVDPILLLERYLWRGGHKFAIAQHKYNRDIFVEADANKRRKRYARPLIDKHMNMYRKEGMQPWSESKLPLISDVPEGAVIIREHTPVTDLFGCLWFNEVDRFTPRDQLSFGYVVYRLNGSFSFFMFPNCEYNSIFLLHKHTREHSSKVEWVKSLDELNNAEVGFETRAGLGLRD